MGVKQYCKLQKFIPQHLHQGFVDTYVHFGLYACSTLSFQRVEHRYDMTKNNPTGLKQSIKSLVVQISDTTNLWSLCSLLSGQYFPILTQPNAHKGIHTQYQRGFPYLTSNANFGHECLPSQCPDVKVKPALLAHAFGPCLFRKADALNYGAMTLALIAEEKVRLLPF